MLVYFIIFLILLLVLLFIAQALFQNLFALFYRLLKDKNGAIQFLSWLLLPGIIIHELSHMLTAGILGVKTGALNFIPQLLADNQIKVGSLKIAKTDPFRQTLIGLAPSLIGLAILSYLTNLKFSNYYLLIPSYYLIFAVSNTMFSSKKDLEAALFPIILVVILGGVFWLAGFKITLSSRVFDILFSLFKPLNLGLGITILIDLFLLSLTKILNFVIIKLNG